MEDLISTGKSSLNAIDAIKNNGGNVIGLISIFTYDFLNPEKLATPESIQPSKLLDAANSRSLIASSEFKYI